ncbi:MAG: choice-of-anchor P family protein, partial [Candidatus Polarisedimenticolia bacterium]
MHSGVRVWIGALALALGAWPAGPARAETGVTGSATALKAKVVGVTTTLAGTGPLASINDSRFSSTPGATIAGLGGAEALHASTISSVRNWEPLDEVSSGASLGELSLSVAGQQIAAAFAMAWAATQVDGTKSGGSTLEGLRVNGVSIAPTGAPNQRVVLPGVTLTLNEQTAT